MRSTGWPYTIHALAWCAVWGGCAQDSVGRDCPDGGRCDDAEGAAGPEVPDADVACFGEQITCDSPEHQLPVGWDRLHAEGKPGPAFPALPAAWERPIEGLREGYQVQAIFGDGAKGMFLLATNADQGSALLGRFDEHAAVVAQWVVTAPPFEAIPAHAREWATGEEVGWSWCSPVAIEGGVGCSWSLPCEQEAPEANCLVNELILFSEAEFSTPVRIFPQPIGAERVQWARASDGGAWEFRAGVLRKYDRDGQIRASQNVLADRSPFYYPPDQAYLLTDPVLAVAPNDDVLVYARLESGKSELWRFDAHGAPLAVIDVPFAEPSTLRTDANSAVVLYSMSTWGDVVQRSIARDHTEAASRAARRTGYYDMYIGEVSEDSAGNAYVLTRSGSSGRATLTLCAFASSAGSGSCFEISGRSDPWSGVMVAHGERQVFLLKEENSSAQGTLLRFELPR